MLKLTEEQQTIINSFPSLHEQWKRSKIPENNLLINALAGCAKTSTILELVKAYPETNFQMMCFNAKNSKELNERIKSQGLTNFEAATFHKKAVDWFCGIHGRGRKLGGGFNISVLLDMLRKGNVSADYDIAVALLNLIKSYCASYSYESFTSWAVENSKLNLPLKVYEIVENFMGLHLTQYFKESTPFDIVIKYYQLTAPSFMNSDSVLIIEEFQDINSNQTAIINKQDCFKIAIGDVHQNIYSWRASGALITETANWKGLQLTTSFRVNKEDEKRANRVLEMLEVNGLKLNGVSKKTQVETEAWLFRTNHGVVAKCLELYDKGINFNVNASFTSLWSELWYIHSLLFGKEFKGKPPASVSWLKTKKELETAASKLNDIKSLVNLYNTISTKKGGLYGISKMFKNLEEKYREYGEIYPITVGTIHLFKGLEADEVFVGDDFTIDFDQEDRAALYEELRILYIAVTRAKVRTNLPEELSYLID